MDTFPRTTVGLRSILVYSIPHPTTMSGPILIPKASTMPSNPCSPSTSLSESPEIRLAPSTIAMLDSFLAEKAEEERLFRELERQALDGELEHNVNVEDVKQGNRGISVDEFRAAFSEDWQLSQFW